MKRTLWRLFSEFIRLRDSDHKGKCTCVTCGAEGYYKGDRMSAGHFVPVISRWGHNATYFDERNVHVQCYHCNRMEEGRGWQMGMYIAQKYGEDMPGYLWTLAAEPWKFTGPWFNERINYYRAEVKKLKNQKDLSE